MDTSPITLGVGNGAVLRLLLLPSAQRVAPPAQNQPPRARQAEFVICDQAIELAFKRLKGQLRLATLRAKDPRLARACLLAKLILGLLVERLIAPARRPCGG